MKMNRFFGMLALIIGVVLVGCNTGTSSGGGGSNPQTVTYSGTASNGDQYKLEITENKGRAAYATVSGDSYKLIEVINNKTSTGTVEPAFGATYDNGQIWRNDVTRVGRADRAIQDPQRRNTSTTRYSIYLDVQWDRRGQLRIEIKPIQGSNTQ